MWHMEGRPREPVNDFSLILSNILKQKHSSYHLMQLSYVLSLWIDCSVHVNMMTVHELWLFRSRRQQSAARQTTALRSAGL
jgi:hypothetical protein